MGGIKVPFRLFTNTSKIGNQPDYKSGSINIDGAMYRLAAWYRKNTDGSTYLSCSLETEGAKPAAGPTMEENIALLKKVQRDLGKAPTPPPDPNDVPWPDMPF